MAFNSENDQIAELEIVLKLWRTISRNNALGYDNTALKIALRALLDETHLDKVINSQLRRRLEACL